MIPEKQKCADFFSSAGGSVLPERDVTGSNPEYKDRGGPAQLGTRDWAGLKGHGADRDLARYGGQKRAPRGRLRVTPVGTRICTERQKVGVGWVIIRFDSNN